MRLKITYVKSKITLINLNCACCEDCRPISLFQLLTVCGDNGCYKRSRLIRVHTCVHDKISLECKYSQDKGKQYLNQGKQ